MLRILALLLLLGGSTLSTPFPRKEIAKPRADDVDYHLSGDIVPKRYEIILEPNFEDKTFKGEVKIDIEVIESTKDIILHQLNLVMPDKEKFTVTDTITQEQVTVDTVGSYGTSEQEFYKISVDTDLTVGKIYRLEIEEFLGTLNEGNRGFYYAEYTDANGELKKFATTQFEPTKAREAFPCFDEPAMKAIFQITIRRPPNYNSVSNMPQKASSSVEDVYEDTVEMSTYLIAFIVSEMKLSDKVGIQQVLARPEDIDARKADFALNTGDAVLNGIAEWLDVPYSLPKMDQAAIPDNYFSAGAMENWGLVTYRETYLLYSEETTIITRQQSIATIIAHEFGHQWFGNLVSPEWWQYIWLNEGFATYFEFFGAALAYPSWNMMDQFVVKNTQAAFGPDSLESTRIMNLDAGTPREISNLFDRIAYEKSGSVIRMMEMFLTTAVYKRGLKYYLEDRSFKAANPDHLYDFMQKSVNDSTPKVLPDDLTVSQILKSWDSAEGYPVVTVLRNYGSVDNNVVLNQSRFLLLNSTSENTNNWIIPVNFAKSNNDFSDTTASVWFKTKEETVTVSDLTDSNWLIVNKQQTGYYRVNYDERNWNLLSDALNTDHTQIHLLNRAQLIDDAFNLARSQRLAYSIPLQLSLYLNKETEYIPLYSFFTAVNFLNGKISGTTGESYLQTHILNALTAVYTHLGFDEKSTDSHVDKLNRISVLSWLCNLGHSECRTKSLEKFKAWQENDSAVALNLQSPIFCGAMRQADEAEWNYLFGQYVSTSATSDSEKTSRIFNALGCSENPTILKTFLDKAVANENSITTTSGFASVYNGGNIGFQTAFDYVVDNFQNLNTQLTTNQLTSILTGIGNKITTKEQLDTLVELSKDQNTNLFQSAIAAAEGNVAWNEVNLVSINSWFTRDQNTDDGSMSYMYFSTTLIVFGYIICMQL